MKWKPVITLGASLLLVLGARLAARPDFTFPDNSNLYPKIVINGSPNVNLEVHKINRLALSITNNGCFGTGYFGGSPVDPETGVSVLACEYPINSNIEYLWVGALWVGAVIGRDTLVSCGAEGYYDIVELWPDAGDNGEMIRRSTQTFSIHYSPDAISEEDIICKYFDTLNDPGLVVIDPVDNRPHRPLNLEITQRSYAWSYPYADDFILFDFEIKNIGQFPLKQLYIGLVVDADAYHISSEGSAGSWMDDICGYKEMIPSPIWPGYYDSVNVAWVADNDGDPGGGVFDFSSVTGVTATRVIRTPSDSLEYSCNWWVTQYTPANDWGPRQVTDDKPYRNFGPNFGTPLGDRNKYYVLSTREFDYDQLECAVSHAQFGWMSPPRDAEDFANGHNSIYLFSFGPFDVAPDSVLPVVLAYIGGEDLHHNPNAWNDLFNPLNPYPYMEQLDFKNLGLNSIWADWIYDNPGYDTDNDGDSGMARWFYSPDSTDSNYNYYRGDGIPDFRGASPPPAPELKVLTDQGQVIIRWNGEETENSVDVFSKQKDFEGYKIYYAEDNRISDFVLLATYDRCNYNVLKWNNLLRRWEVSETPLDYDSLILIYGEGFEPELYTEFNSLRPDDPRNPEPVYTYFTPQNWNVCDLSDPHGIHRVYPHADANDPDDTTDDGDHRFYEYEYIIDNLSLSRPIYVAVTTFDYGSRTHFLSSLESSILTNATQAYPMTSSDEVEAEGLGVSVYPNPYRIDASYAEIGYENRDRTKSAERSRAVHFTNLPAVCTIQIFTIAGDLVQEIDHYYPGGGPESMHETWNLISRNTQAITTGIYIWSVRSEMGEQLGKLVIIK
jgi:hypothetical protein